METAKYLEKVGDRNRFQIFSIIFVCLKWWVVSLTVFLPSYLFVTPTFTCGLQSQVTENDACGRIQNCSIQFPETITAHMRLYCDNRWLRGSILSVQFVGSITGLILLSILADKLGRKTIIMSTLCLTCIGAISLTMGSNLKSMAFIYIGQFLLGFGSYSLSMVSYSYLSQINNDIWRQKSLVLTYSFWAIGEISLYPIIVFIKNWNLICISILLVMSFFICQTPQFLYVRKRYDQCLKSLNYIAKFNGKQQLSSIQQPLPGQQKQAEAITDTFTKPQFLIPLVVLSFAQICNNGLYYATQYSITQLGYSFQINMLVIGTLQLVACLITNHYCERMYRKRWIMTFMIVAGVIGLILQFSKQKSQLQITLIGISRLCNTFSFALFSLITTQSFPTSIRSTGTGISEAMSNVGNMSAPFLVTLGDKIGVRGVFISGIVCIIGGLSMFFVKQTKKSDQQKDGQNKLEVQANKNNQLS